MLWRVLCQIRKIKFLSRFDYSRRFDTIFFCLAHTKLSWYKIQKKKCMKCLHENTKITGTHVYISHITDTQKNKHV